MAKALRISNAGGRSLVVIDEGAGRLKMEAEQRQTVNIPVVMVSKLKGEDACTIDKKRCERCRWHARNASLIRLLVR